MPVSRSTTQGKDPKADPAVALGCTRSVSAAWASQCLDVTSLPQFCLLPFHPVLSPYRGPCRHGELLPLWNRTLQSPTLTIFLRSHSPTSTICIRPPHSASSDWYLLLFLPPAWTSGPSSPSLPCSPGYPPHFRQNLHLRSLQLFTLFFFFYSQSFIGPPTKIQSIFGKINTKSCVHCSQCAAMQSRSRASTGSCTHVPSHISHSRSTHSHPTASSTALNPPRPQEMTLSLHGHIREQTGPCVLSFPLPPIRTFIRIHAITCLSSSHFNGESCTTFQPDVSICLLDAIYLSSLEPCFVSLIFADLF